MAGKNSKKRPDHINAFGVKVLNSRNNDIRKLRKVFPPAIHGTKCWKSSYLIMDYLRENGLPKGKKKKCRVMEVGCGWGLASIFCAKEFGAKVTGTDADEMVFPYLDLHTSTNGVKMQRYAAKFQDLTVTELSEFDLILAADICFWDKLVKPLWKLVRNAMDAGVQQVIIADPGRDPFETMTRKCIKRFDAQRIEREIDDPVKAYGFLCVVDR